MGMLCHLLALAGVIGVPFGNILGPLIMWLVKKDEMAFVDDQGKESLNFQITVTVAVFVLGVLSFIPIVGCITLLALLAACVGAVVLVIIASVKAAAGEPYRYPMTIRFIQ